MFLSKVRWALRPAKIHWFDSREPPVVAARMQKTHPATAWVGLR